MELRETLTKHLQQTVQECLLRGLFQSANWACEQLQGFVETNAIEPSSTIILTGEAPYVMQASALLSMGNYIRSAQSVKHLLTQSNTSVLALFQYTYSKYLAGEKRKAQFQIEKLNQKEIFRKGKGKKIDILAVAEMEGNPYISELFNLLKSKRQSGKFDGYLLYLFAILARDFYAQNGPTDGLLEERSSQEEPLRLFMQALATNPWNWSCWLDFAKYISDQRLKVPSWDEICASVKVDSIVKQAGRIMFTFFMSHVYLEKHRGDLSLQALGKLHKIFPTSLYILSQVALAYYSQRLYDQAEECFGVIRSRDPFRLQHIDTFSNILYVKEKLPELTSLAHEVLEAEKYAPEVCCVVGNYYSLKNSHEKAVLYFQRALRLDSNYLSAWTLMGHEYMELRNTGAAVQCYRNAIQICETDYRAWYGLGQTYEMLHLYQYALYYFKKATSLRPSDARLWSAVGNCLLKLGLKAEAIGTYERAVAAGDREGIATRDLARLYRDDDEQSKAANMYYKFLKCNLFSVAEGDDEQPIPQCECLEELVDKFRAWRDSTKDEEEFDVVVDSDQGEALFYIANYFRTRQPLLSGYFCQRLLNFSGPEGDEARILLKDLRSELKSQHVEKSPLRNAQRHTSVLGDNTVSPLFSPWKRFNHGSHGNQPS